MSKKKPFRLNKAQFIRKFKAKAPKSPVTASTLTAIYNKLPTTPEYIGCGGFKVCFKSGGKVYAIFKKTNGLEKVWFSFVKKVNSPYLPTILELHDTHVVMPFYDTEDPLCGTVAPILRSMGKYFEDCLMVASADYGVDLADEIQRIVSTFNADHPSYGLKNDSKSFNLAWTEDKKLILLDCLNPVRRVDTPAVL